MWESTRVKPVRQLWWCLGSEGEAALGIAIGIILLLPLSEDVLARAIDRRKMFLQLVSIATSSSKGSNSPVLYDRPYSRDRFHCDGAPFDIPPFVAICITLSRQCYCCIALALHFLIHYAQVTAGRVFVAFLVRSI
jgi:hypothetical protein